MFPLTIIKTHHPHDHHDHLDRAENVVVASRHETARLLQHRLEKQKEKIKTNKIHQLFRATRRGERIQEIIDDNDHGMKEKCK